MNYYNKMINDLLASNVTPMVTLYHFDLPQALQDQGGWTWAGIADVFEAYAAFCFRTFGDRVKTWLTLNEPYVCAKLGHEDGLFAPGHRDPGVSAYLAGHNMLRAHAKAWRAYHALFRREQKGLVSLALNSDWAEPLDPGSPQDVAATQRYMAFTFGWFASPVFMTGDYPATMRSQIEARNRTHGFPDSRLPVFTETEPGVLGTADFFALNYYTSRRVRAVSSPSGALSFKGDREAEEVLDPSWPVCGAPWLAVVPDGLRKLLKYIKVKGKSEAGLMPQLSVIDMKNIRTPSETDVQSFIVSTLKNIGRVFCLKTLNFLWWWLASSCRAKALAAFRNRRPKSML